MSDTPTTTEDRKHHPFSPSSIGSIEACPCYQGRQPVKLHERTKAGTIAHKAVETEEDDQRLKDWDAVAVAECIDFALEKKTELEQECPGEVIVVKEAYLPADDETFLGLGMFIEGTTAGFVDHIYIRADKKRAVMIDWKFGMWPVDPAESNPQGIAYIIGLFKRYPELESVELWFKQPHLGLTTTHTFYRNMMADYYLRVKVAVARAREARMQGDFSMALPFAPVCSFCDNIGRCPKVAEVAIKISEKYAPLELPADITPGRLLAPDAASMGLRACQVVKAWADGFRRQITERILLREMELPPGQTIEVREKGNRKIFDFAKFKAVVLKWVPQSVLDSCLDASFGPIEDHITEQAPRGHKSKAVKEFQQELESAGAVTHGEGFSFLKAIPVKKEKTTTQ